MILALDTATATASLALYDPRNQMILVEQTWQARRRQTEQLLPVLQQVMDQADLQPDAIRTVAVTTGPGSFTGVRIAISVAKGIALGATTMPTLVGVPTLSVTAAPWIEAAHAAGDAEIWAFIQAGRGRYNWAVFAAGDLTYRPDVSAHRIGNVERLEAELAALNRPVWLVGETTQAIQQMAVRLDHLLLIDATSGLRRASALARLAALHEQAGHVESVDSLQPLYLREPS